MKEVNLYCTHDGKQIGRVFGRFISRSKAGKNFYGDMDEPSEDCPDLAVIVSDPQAKLKTQWYKDPVLKVSGV